MTLFNFTQKKHIPTLAFAILFAFIASLATPALALILGDIFNAFTLFGGGAISSQELSRTTSKFCIALAGVGAAGWFFHGFYFITFVIFGELQVATARCELFNGLLEKDQEWFETLQSGSKTFSSSIQGNLHELQMATSQPLGLVLHYSFRTTNSLGLAFFTSWKLSLVTMAGIPVSSAIVSFLSTRMKPSVEAQQEELSRASKIVNSTTSAIDTVKYLNGQAIEAQSFSNAIKKAASQYLRHARLNALQISIVRLMMFGMFVQGFWYGSALARSGRLSSGEVLRTFWACLSAAQSIELVLPQIILLEKGKLASSLLASILNSDLENKAAAEMKGVSYPRYCEGDVEVKNLSFAYATQPDEMRLNAANLFFPAGETTFVIGKSGSGKSTLGQLLARFYLPTSGEILIDGKLIQNLNVDWIRNNITVVEQRSVLFNETILMNIAFGRREYDQIRKEDVQECIELVMLQSVIDNMPHGINTCVGHGGNFLSGGQRQRIAIARAKLRDTPILILDEPTSALDSTNRLEVIRAIRRWRKGKTTIIITHDMSQILPRDFVYILEQGSVVHSGYRNHLVKRPGTEKYFSSHEKDNSSRRGRVEANLAETGTWLCTDSSSSSSTESLHEFMARKELNSRTESHPRRGVFPSDRGRVNPPRLDRQNNARAGDTAINFPGIPMDDLSILQRNRSGTKSRRSVHEYRLSMSHTPYRIKPNKYRLPPLRRKMKSRQLSKTRHSTSLGQIMSTVMPSLTTTQRVCLLFGCICTLAHACATPVFSYCLSQLLQTFYDTHLSPVKWALVVLGVSIGDGIVSYFMHYYLELCGQAWVDFLRKQAFCRVLDQPKKWFEEDENGPANITTCFGQDAEEMRNLVGRFGGFALLAVAISVLAIAWSLVICWKLTLIALSCSPVIYVITRGFDGTTGLWERRCNEAATVASEIFVETFSEIRTVRMLTLEPFFHKKYLKAAATCTAAGLRKAFYTGFLFGLVESMIMFISALIFYYGAVLVSSGQFKVRDIMTAFSMLLFSIGYASIVLSWIPQISTSRDMGSRLLRLANLPEGSSHEHIGTAVVSKIAPINITSLDFRYPSRPDAFVLKDVSIDIPEGSSTAIVGRSGSGKSTIASLLLGLYEVPPSTGKVPRILLNKVDIRQLHTPTLRSSISLVSQQPTIFPGTIHANICYGLDEGSPMRSSYNVRCAAEAAGLDEFISSLPQDYQTVIGDGGVGLSGGQAQRLVIARALVRRPQMLILDEATSALDPASADVIRSTVQRLVAAQLGLTVIILTHAKEMMEIADNVVVLEQGCVVAEGPYTSLCGEIGGGLQTLFEENEDTSGD
ncbi:P-loop containing nucleoside triphosphate hydrolase protein [Aspergillus ambiguus]|uniref:ABC transporter ATP-binding protein n=1 Tax=Aspergillus ambiguus TaxID=176160 RepID=UPI003CCD8DD1